MGVWSTRAMRSRLELTRGGDESGSRISLD